MDGPIGCYVGGVAEWGGHSFLVDAKFADGMYQDWMHDWVVGLFLLSVFHLFVS